MAPGRPPDGSDEDADAFAEAMRGARPLGGPRDTRADAPPTRRPGKRMPVPAASPFIVERTDENIAGRAADVGPPVVRALRAGDPPVDARLDLHGRAAADAAHALERFLVAARSRAARVALVIHGRGQGSESGAPVVRPAVWDWLASPAAARAGVKAFSSAAPREGGVGATLVLLRRPGR
jgi:DNA-nicking Smr family endonuclease